jgi:hypothetical protein
VIVGDEKDFDKEYGDRGTFAACCLLSSACCLLRGGLFLLFASCYMPTVVC